MKKKNYVSIYLFGFVGKVYLSKRRSTKNELVKIIITIITTVKSYSEWWFSKKH